MTVIRVEKTKNYTVMSNCHLKEKDMSLNAKGLLSLMLSLPDNWDYSVAGLVAICKESYLLIKKTLNELKEFGYLKILKKMPNATTSGRIEYEYVVYEQKQEVEKQDLEIPFTEIPFTEKQEVEKQEVEKQEVEKQEVENQRQLNTNILNTKELNTNIVNNKEIKERDLDIIDHSSNINSVDNEDLDLSHSKELKLKSDNDNISKSTDCSKNVSKVVNTTVKKGEWLQELETYSRKRILYKDYLANYKNKGIEDIPERSYVEISVEDYTNDFPGKAVPSFDFYLLGPFEKYHTS